MHNEAPVASDVSQHVVDDIIRIYIRYPESARVTATSASDGSDHDDSDADVPRRKRFRRPDLTALTLKSTAVSTLDDCGMQLWAASLTLVDLIVENRAELAGRVVIELGAGVGT